MASGFFLFFKGNLPSKIFSEEAPKTNNVVIDSLLLEAIEEAKPDDSIDEKQAIKADDKEDKTSNDSNDNVYYIDESELVSNESELSFKGMIYLESFYAKLFELEQSKTKRVRIGYYGDSMTDGDMIVQDLRKNYQNKYSGGGVGYIPITVESAKSRGSVVHRYSPNWKVQSYLNVKKPIKPFGVSGQVFFVKDTIKDTWVSLQAGNIKNMTSLHTPTLYFGSSNNTKGKVSVIIGKDTIVKSLNASAELNRLKLADGNIRQIKVMFQHADSIPIYGIDVSANTGVQVDNFSSRGNSGLPLSLLKVSLMQKFQRNLDYNLIVLHYGTNVLNYGSYNYSWYTKQMNRVVSHLKQCFPNASILVISTADKGTKYDLTMKTDSAVLPLVKAQRKYAMESHTGFFNLYEAMGGEGSMVKWVEESPVKANKDYTHFNFKGAQEVSNLIFERLESGYADYKQKKEAALKVEVKKRADSIRKVEEEKALNTNVLDTIKKHDKE